MRNLKYISILLVIILVWSCNDEKITFSETGKITGRVVKAQIFEPISNAKVSISPSNNTTFSDEDGYFTFEEIPIGDYSLQAEKEGYLAGYEPASLDADATVNIVFELEESDALNKPPIAPELLSPEDGSTDLGLEVELVWSKATDLDEDSLEYGLQIRNDYNEALISVQNITDTTYVISNLQHGVKYFWQVSVNDGHHEDVLTSISTFKTSSYPNNRYFYVKETDGNNVIYSNDIDGEELQITSSSRNSWRPRKNQTAKLVAFLQTNDTETHIFTMNPDGTDIRQVTSEIPLVGFKQSEIDFSWSTNGNYLIYPSFDKLYMINKDGSGNHLIYQTPDSSYITECDWSNDGSLIALKTNDINGYNIAIFVIDLSGNVVTNVLSGVNGAAGGLNLSIDNNYLLYTYDSSGHEDASYRQLDSNIFLYDFAADTSTNLSTNKEAGTNDLDPRFAPNEASVIFVNTSNDGISEKYIYTEKIDGENRTQLFENTYMPDWE